MREIALGCGPRNDALTGPGGISVGGLHHDTRYGADLGGVGGAGAGVCATAAANTRVLRRLAQVGEALTAAGALLLLLKGAVSAETLYPDPALRLFGDIDLLVPHQALLACRELLLRLGYTSAAVEHGPGTGLAYRNE